jgi:hypothetical protein
MVLRNNSYFSDTELTVFITQMECVYSPVKNVSLNATAYVLFVTVKWAVSGFRRLVAGLSPRRPGFDHRPNHVRFVLD